MFFHELLAFVYKLLLSVAVNQVAAPNNKLEVTLENCQHQK